MDWAKHGNKLVDRITDIISGAFGAGVYHFLTEKRDMKTGQVMLKADGRPQMIVDSDKVRAHAPFWVLGLSDEAEFNGLVSSHLDPALQKNLERKMGPIPLGPFAPGVVPEGIGDHQRSDVILTCVNLNERKNMTPEQARTETIENLRVLGSIADPAEWKRRAIAFKLMKANENDYIGAQLSEQVQQKILSAFREFQQAKQEWDTWANGRAVEMDVWTLGMQYHLRTRPRGFFATLRRMYDLPWNRS